MSCELLKVNSPRVAWHPIEAGSEAVTLIWSTWLRGSHDDAVPVMSFFPIRRCPLRGPRDVFFPDEVPVMSFSPIWRCPRRGPATAALRYAVCRAQKALINKVQWLLKSELTSTPDIKHCDVHRFLDLKQGPYTSPTANGMSFEFLSCTCTSELPVPATEILSWAN